MRLDEFGFPEIAVANRILINIDDYGESKENLEKNWGKWVHHIPFDSPVSRALIKLYTRKLKQMDKEENVAEYQRLERKLDLVQRRAGRYDIDLFAKAD